MTIKQHGGVFGRNPTFNDVEVTGDLSASSVDINGGAIDGATIATSDITVGSGKTLDVSSGTLTLADDQISGDKIDGGTAGVDELIADDVITAGGTTVTHGANSNGTIRVEGSSAPAFALNDTGQSKEYFLTALGDFVQMRYADAGDTGGFANSTSLLTMQATGDVTVNTGNLVIGTSGDESFCYAPQVKVDNFSAHKSARPTISWTNGSTKTEDFEIDLTGRDVLIRVKFVGHTSGTVLRAHEAMLAAFLGTNSVTNATSTTVAEINSGSGVSVSLSAVGSNDQYRITLTNGMGTTVSQGAYSIEVMGSCQPTFI